MSTGFNINSGLKFGLTIPAKKANKPIVKPMVPSIFKLDEEDEKPKDFNEQLKEDAERRKKWIKNKTEQQKVLEEDPTAFDYDGVYDVMQKQKGDRLARIQMGKEEEKKKPKYIFAIKERAVERKIEQDIIYDRVQRKEQAQEEAEFGQVEKFVTSAYKEKLKKDKIWLEEEAKREAREEDVTKKQDLTAFYAGLLTKNVAMGAESEAEKLTKKQLKEREKKLKEEEERKQKRAAEEAAKKLAEQTEEEKLRIQTKKEMEELERQKLEELGEEGLQQLKEERRKQRELDDKEKEQREKEETEKKRKEREDEAARKMARHNDEKSIADAKARYLARKAGRTTQPQEQPQ